MAESIVKARLSGMARAIPPPPPSFTTPDSPVRFDLSGGSPDPGSLPVPTVIAATIQALEADGQSALQYGEGPGYAGLVEQLLIKLRRDNGLDLSLAQVVLTTGASQAVGLLCTALIDPGDTIFAEEPTWSGAVRMFATHRANVFGIPMDENGMRLDILADELAGCRERGIQPKLIYTIPTFQNPTGVTLSLARRRELLRLAKEYGLVVIEDDAYFDLRFAGERLPMLGSLDADGIVVTVGTFSKIFAAGMRLGWAVGSPELIQVLTRLKPPGGTNPIASYVTASYAASGALEAHIAELVQVYRLRRDAMLEALSATMPESAGIGWTKPEGGFFVWLSLPEALAHGVAFVPGSLFSNLGGARNQMRLSYSFADEEQIRRGIEILAGIIRERLADQ